VTLTLTFLLNTNLAGISSMCTGLLQDVSAFVSYRITDRHRQTDILRYRNSTPLHRWSIVRTVLYTAVRT